MLGAGAWDEAEYLLELTGMDYEIAVEEKRKKKKTLIHWEEKMDMGEGRSARTSLGGHEEGGRGEEPSKSQKTEDGRNPLRLLKNISVKS